MAAGWWARLQAKRPWWRIYPTRRLAGVVLAAAVAWIVPVVGAKLALALIAAIAVAALADYLLLPRRYAIVVERGAPDMLGLGDAADITYTLRSSWAWSARATLYDRIPEGISGELGAGEHDVPPLDERSLALSVVGETRGRYALGPIAMRIVTPLGLLARIVVTPPKTDESITVVPSLTNVRRFRLLALQNRLSEAGVRALKLRGEGTAFAGLRDYVPGDDPRLLDWKATARHGRLISREQTIERSQTVLSLIDCGRAMTQLAGHYSRFEHVLSAALVLSDVAATSGDRVGLVAFDDQIRASVPPQRGDRALRALHRSLSGLEATLTEPDYLSAFRVLATSQRRRALVVFFTDVVSVRSAKNFIAYAGRSAQRHLLVVVAIQNEALMVAAKPSTEGATALYRSAAAEELVRERDEALARMRGAGLVVLDVSPARMAATVVNRYLEIKARGQL
ncbi:MAG TPA: DUF58 domain-containing protein [Gemmatimonadaceae bacterium]|jgi:uncharacterized protein (DUF58 family)|nr:DUF58 domain-containing protein [Gemmatimonadaceae bacterium]